MKRKRFSEEQIIGILKEHETGIAVADLCRKHGVSDASIYKWKARYGGLDVSEAKRLNRRSKSRLASPLGISCWVCRVCFRAMRGMQWGLWNKACYGALTTRRTSSGTPSWAYRICSRVPLSLHARNLYGH